MSDFPLKSRSDLFYPVPSLDVRHTVAFCLRCGCVRTFSYGFCDHWVDGVRHYYLSDELVDL
jgi:hypothetical protein